MLLQADSPYAVSGSARYGKNYAADTFADITRSQWNDYLNRFLPVQQQLIDSVSGAQLLDEQLSRIGGNYQQAANQSAAVQAFRNQRYGTAGANSGQQATSDATQSALSNALSYASTMNTTRQDNADRTGALISGSSLRSSISTGG